MSNMNQSKRPRDKNGSPHGEWVIYFSNGSLSLRHNYVHGIRHGLCEGYYIDGRLAYRGYMNSGKSVGFWYTSQRNKYYLCLL